MPRQYFFWKYLNTIIVLYCIIVQKNPIFVQLSPIQCTYSNIFIRFFKFFPANTNIYQNSYRLIRHNPPLIIVPCKALMSLREVALQRRGNRRERTPCEKVHCILHIMRILFREMRRSLRFWNHVIASDNAHSFACVRLFPKSTKYLLGSPICSSEWQSTSYRMETASKTIKVFMRNSKQTE